MSVVVQLAGKRYTISSGSVDQVLLEQAAALLDEAAREMQIAVTQLPEGQLCAMVAMRCLVPLLEKQREIERNMQACIEELDTALKKQ